MRYTKHLIQIGDQVFNFGDDFTASFDLNNVINTLSFSLPFFKQGKVDTTNIQKYDLVKLYFDTTIDETNLALYNERNMPVVFYGYVEYPELRQDNSGYHYSINCKSTSGICFERPAPVEYVTGSIDTIMSKAEKDIDLKGFIPKYTIDDNISPNVELKIDDNDNFGEVLNNIKEKYAIQIFQTGEGVLKIQFPKYLNAESVDAWVFSPYTNIEKINTGNLSNSYDAVQVIGNNCTGLAFDPIAYQLKNGARESELIGGFKPIIERLHILPIFRRDVFSEEECREIARAKLLEMAKNYTVSFDVNNFDKNFQVGDTFVVHDHPKISASQVWIIKTLDIKISGSDAVTCSITGYSNSANDFPEDVLLDDENGVWNTELLAGEEKTQLAYEF